MKHKLLSGWHAMRLLRLGLSLLLIIHAFQSTEWSMLVFAAIFLFQAIFNVGCCGTGTCAPMPPRRKNNNTTDISFEEIK